MDTRTLYMSREGLMEGENMEFDPMIQNDGAAKPARSVARGGELNLETMLKDALRIRFPRVNEDGEFVAEAKPRQANPQAGAGVSQAFETAQEGAAAEGVATFERFKSQALALIPLDLTALRPGDFKFEVPRSKEEVLMFAQRYMADITTQAVYILGWAVSAFMVKSVALQFYWVLGMGMLTSVLMVVKSCWSITIELFEFMDMAVDEINAAIDVLQQEVEDEFKEQVMDALEGQPDMVVRGVFISITGPVRRSIDDAQIELTKDVDQVLPCPVRTKLNFMGCFATPLLLIVILKGVLSLAFSPEWRPHKQAHTPAPPAAPGQRWLQTAPLPSTLAAEQAQQLQLGLQTQALAAQAAQLRLQTRLQTQALAAQALAAQAEEEEAREYWDNTLHTVQPMLVTLILNTVFAVLGSFPIQRGLTNFAIGTVQTNVNTFILNLVKDNFPGGLSNLQGWITYTNRVCSRDCSPAACAMM